MKQEETSSQGYYYEMPEKELQIFIEKVKSLELNDSVTKVKDVLGDPRYDDDLIGKKGEFVARAVDYYIKIWREKGVNVLHDKVVSFYFDENGLLFEISSNVEGIPSEKSTAD